LDPWKYLLGWEAFEGNAHCRAFGSTYSAYSTKCQIHQGSRFECPLLLAGGSGDGTTGRQDVRTTGRQDDSVITGVGGRGGRTIRLTRFHGDEKSSDGGSPEKNESQAKFKINFMTHFS